ncbi:MAG: hypothetical protein AB8B55_15600 [Mariniblastus sp.]
MTELPTSDDSEQVRSLFKAAAEKKALALSEAKAAAVIAGKEPFDPARIDADWPWDPRHSLGVHGNYPHD